MKTYTLIDNLGNEIVYEHISELETFLSQSFAYWEKGTGDSAIEIQKGERIVFFKIEQGFFLMQHPDYLVPLSIFAEKDERVMLSHYVGGQEFLFPKTVIYSKEVAITILKNYIEQGELDKAYNWVDICSFIDSDF